MAADRGGGELECGAIADRRQPGARPGGYLTMPAMSSTALRRFWRRAGLEASTALPRCSAPDRRRANSDFSLPHRLLSDMADGRAGKSMLWRVDGRGSSFTDCWFRRLSHRCYSHRCRHRSHWEEHGKTPPSSPLCSSPIPPNLPLPPSKSEGCEVAFQVKGSPGRRRA